LADSTISAPAVYALTRYAGPARAAILAGKERGRRELPPLLGGALGRALHHLQDVQILGSGCWLIPAPSRRAAARARGGDPVLAMVRSAARRLASEGRSTGVAPCLLTTAGARDSVGLDAAARAANLAGRVRFRTAASPTPDAEVVLIDDVLTSGATVAAALSVLKEAGIAVSLVLVIASVPTLRPLTVGSRSPLRRPGSLGRSDPTEGPCHEGVASR
jgi:predicted amidophosphoribosyltransferase